MAITTLSVEQALYVNAAPTPAVTRDTMQHKLPLGRRPQSVLCYHDTNLYAELDLLWFLLQTVVGWVRERISDTHKRIHELRWRGGAILFFAQIFIHLHIPGSNLQSSVLPSCASICQCHFEVSNISLECFSCLLRFGDITSSFYEDVFLGRSLHLVQRVHGRMANEAASQCRNTADKKDNHYMRTGARMKAVSTG